MVKHKPSNPPVQRLPYCKPTMHPATATVVLKPPYELEISLPYTSSSREPKQFKIKHVHYFRDRKGEFVPETLNSVNFDYGANEASRLMAFLEEHFPHEHVIELTFSFTDGHEAKAELVCRLLKQLKHTNTFVVKPEFYQVGMFRGPFDVERAMVREEQRMMKAFFGKMMASSA